MSIAEQLNKLPFEEIVSLDLHRMKQIYCNACGAIAEYAPERTDPASSQVGEPSPGTTALCAIELQHCILIAYCGNGAILHVRPNFNEFPETSLLPWSAINILNPHSHPVRGKNVLYKYVSATAEIDEAEPTVLVLSKDDALMGDIIVVVTDGIWSYDQASIGENEMGIWMHVESTLPLLYRHLDSFFHREYSTARVLKGELEAYLDAVRASGKMTDDCTIGVLVTGRAVAYQRNRLAKKAQEQEHEIDHHSVVG